MEELPDELVLAVLRCLPAEDLLVSCRAVCRRWRGLALDPSLWRHRELVFKPRPHREGAAGLGAGAVHTVRALRLVPCLASLRLSLPPAGPAAPAAPGAPALAALLYAACRRPLNLSRLELSTGATGSAGVDTVDEDDSEPPTEDAAEALAAVAALMLVKTCRQLRVSAAGPSQMCNAAEAVGAVGAVGAAGAVKAVGAGEAGAANHSPVRNADDSAVAADTSRLTAELLSLAHAIASYGGSTPADQDAVDAAQQLARRGLVRALRAQLSPTLRSLALTFSYLEPQAVRYLFETLGRLPELTELRLEYKPGEQGQDGGMLQLPPGCVRVEQNCGRVTNLHIAGLSDKFAEALVWMQAGSLEHLHLSCPDGLVSVLPVVSEHCARLHSLTLRGWWKLSNQDQPNYLALEQFFKGATQLKSLRLDYKLPSIFEPQLLGSEDLALLRYILPALASNASARGGRPALLETLTLDFLHVYQPQHGEQMRRALEGLPHLHTLRVDCLSNDEECVLSDALARCRAPQLRLVELLGCDAVCPNADEGCSGLVAALRLVRRNPSLHVAGVGLRNGAPWEERWLGVYGHPEEELFACPVCLEHGVGTMQWLSCAQAEHMMKEVAD